MEPLLKVKDLAQVLQIPEGSVYRLCAEGKLPVLRVGVQLRFNLDEVMDFIRGEDQ